jgi:hypothetical protein
MNILQLTTWNRLSALDFDAAEAALPFSKRLAQENGWSAAFAGRAIEEYRKFCFLAVHAGHPVTPSDEVDQVWHLHLLYSRHYWENLCRDALERPLHHGPTQGGAAEDHKFNEWYGATLDSYRRYFGEPPEDLWPAAEQRFDPHHRFVRIDKRDVVTIDRALLRRGAVASLAGGGVLAMAAALAQTDMVAPSSNGVRWVIFVAIAAVVTLIALAMRSKRRERRIGAPRGVGKRDQKASACAGIIGGFAAGSGSHSKGSGDGSSNGDGGGNADGGGGGTDGGGGAGCGGSGASAGCGGGGGGGCGGGGGS